MLTELFNENFYLLFEFTFKIILADKSWIGQSNWDKVNECKLRVRPFFHSLFNSIISLTCTVAHPSPFFGFYSVVHPINSSFSPLFILFISLSFSSFFSLIIVHSCFLSLLAPCS